MLSEPEKLSLESFIDRHGLRNVLEAMAEICDAKAEHLEVNWQDKTSARNWRRVAGMLSTTLRRIAVGV